MMDSESHQRRISITVRRNGEEGGLYHINRRGGGQAHRDI
jgi:hypothetical protein